MHIIQAIILGIVEGFTEFLPISSTGHLILAERALNFDDYKDVFTVVIQSGAIAAVVWYYRKDLLEKTIGLFKGKAYARHFWKLLVIGTIPAGIIGLLLDNATQNITTPLVVALALIVGGIILLLVDRGEVDATHGDEPNISKLSLKQAFIIGIGQCLAIIPGVSRSGATIVTGLGIGIDRATITAFSFYLSIPVLVLASGLKLVKHGDALGNIAGGTASIVVGLIFAFITALISISWLLRYISHHNFQVFAYYRIVVGVLILLLLGVL